MGQSEKPFGLLRHYRATGTPIGAVLVLHGGKERSEATARWFNPGVLRCWLLARSLHRTVRAEGVDVWRVRYNLRGWNEPQFSALGDATSALETVRSATSLPIVLVGHSMGGRVAIRLGGEARIAGLVLLAPWIPPSDPIDQLVGQRLAFAHGSSDRVTNPAWSRACADRAAELGAEVSYQLIENDGHALLKKRTVWDQFVATSVIKFLGSRQEKSGS